ncbi:hypothetical protein NDU88_001689 [Pleurodeles waltl]|uniref:Uncharacterized protein n=1 Tax=Pleurodeles waltl TaxID=8319 RepID=A0AAV7QAV2_PLEWA|nr:hypothetical protein NDU88_001689 [Pleurodeles waltl]
MAGGQDSATLLREAFLAPEYSSSVQEKHGRVRVSLDDTHRPSSCTQCRPGTSLRDRPSLHSVQTGHLTVGLAELLAFSAWGSQSYSDDTDRPLALRTDRAPQCETGPAVSLSARGSQSCRERSVDTRSSTCVCLPDALPVAGAKSRRLFLVPELCTTGGGRGQRSLPGTELS